MANFNGYLQDKNGNKLYPLEDSGWVYPTLSNGWENMGGRDVAYRKIGNVVYWKGAMINKGSDGFNKQIFVIQDSFRPDGDYNSVVCRLGTGLGHLFFNYHGVCNGVVAVENVSGTGTYECSFTGITYIIAD